jgi:hypothetical protein
MKSIRNLGALALMAAFLFSIVNSYGQDNPVKKLVGKWTKSIEGSTISFVMNSDHSYEVDFTGDSGPEVTGSFKVTENKITFTDEGGDYGSDTAGEYEFELGDGSVTFTEVDDPVDGRRMLVEGEWIKAESP